jgi:hypothetical protein
VLASPPPAAVRVALAPRLSAAADDSHVAVAHALDEGLERRDIAMEAEVLHGPHDVLGGDGLAVLTAAPLVGLAGDEADELRHTLLDQLLGFVCDHGVGREPPAHHADHVRERHQPVLLTDHRRQGCCCFHGSGADVCVGFVCSVLVRRVC